MSEVELKLTANIDGAVRDVARFSKEYAQLTRQVEKPLRQVNTFRDLQQTLEGTQKDLGSARDRVRDLGNELAKAAYPSKQLQNEYRAAVSEMKKLERSEGALVNQISRRRTELKGAGVDTRNLAAEQSRLAAELSRTLSAGRSDVAVRDARNALGVGEIENAQRQLVELRRQYQLVTKDGSLSATQRSEAESNYRRTVSESLTRLRDLREATRGTGTSAQDASRLAVIANQNAIQSIRARKAEIQQTAIAEKKAAVEAASSNLGVGRYRALQAELRNTRAQYEVLRRSGSLTARELSIAQISVTQRVRETQRAMRELTAEQRRQRASSPAGALGAIGPVAGAYGAVRAIQGVANITDAYNQMNARLKLVTESQEEFNIAQDELERIADAAQSPLADLVQLYTRIARPLKEAGRGQRDILAITEAVALSFRVSGASAQEAQAGVIQFSQALGAGALRGDEFNSVAEQAPRLMQALAEGIGVPVSALREMAKEGQLTTDVISDALKPQLQTLREEMATLPEAVGASMTSLSNAWNEAVAKADLSPLIEAIDSLKERVQDPATAEGLGRLSGALVRIGAGALGAAADLGDVGDTLGALAASARGSLLEIDRLNNEIRAIEQSLDSSWSPGDLLVRLFFSKEELQAKLAEAKDALAEIQDLDDQADQQASSSGDEASARREAELQQRRAHVEEVKNTQEKQIKDSEEFNKKLLREEKSALSDLQKIRDERIEIEQRYSDALANLGSAGEPSYAGAQDLKIAARQSLQSGDLEQAQKQARAALEMLQDLAEAGENTYGFGGFIKELQVIDLAANQKQQDAAKSKAEDIRAQIESLKTKAKELEGMPVTVEMDEEKLSAAKERLVAFARDMGQLLTFTPTISTPTTLPSSETDDGFARGGWTGPGSKYQVAGVVHADEYVQPKYRMQEPGALQFMEKFRRYGMAALRNGYAEGGLVSSRMLPSIPAMPPSMMAGAGGPRTAIDFTFDGNTYALSGQGDVIDRLARAVKLKKLRS